MQPDLVPNTTGLIVDQREFDMWLCNAEPHAKLCYFIGHLARASATDMQAAVVQKMAWYAARDKKIILTQKRMGEDFEYFATIIPHKRERVEA